MDKNLLQALELIDNLNGSEDIITIKETLSKAYMISERALDAITLLSRFEVNLYKKEKMLKEAIVREYSYLYDEGFKDNFSTKQFIRALYELSGLYKDFEKYPLLIKVYEAMHDITKIYPYKINHDLYALYCYFDNELKNDIDDLDIEDKLLIDCIYEYERSNYELALKLRDSLVLRCPNMIKILDGNEDVVDEKITMMLRRYAFYINRITSVIEFIKTGECQ